MSKTRVYELAKEFGIENKEFIAKLKTLGIAVKSHSSTLEDSEVERVRREFASKGDKEVVEKRVKSTVIRRRAVRLPEAAPEVPAEKVEKVEKVEKEEKVATPEKEEKVEKPEKPLEPRAEEAPEAAAPPAVEKTPVKAEPAPKKEPDLSRQATIIRRPEPVEKKEGPRPPAATIPQTQIRKPAAGQPAQPRGQAAPPAGANARGAAPAADRKGKRAVEVVMDGVAAKKRTLIKQG